MIQQTELSLCLWGKSNWFLERGEKANLPLRRYNMVAGKAVAGDCCAASSGLH